MAKKSMYTRKLGNDVAKNAKGNIGVRYHVIPSQADKWGVVSEGSVKPFKAFTTQKEAVSFAKRTATAKSSVEVIVHGIDGKIKSRIAI